MAVEATHLNPFSVSPQLIQNRDLLNPPPNQLNAGCAFTPSPQFQLFGASTLPENQPFYSPPVDGRFTISSRKRFRDESMSSPFIATAGSEEITMPQFQQQHQIEIDSLISQHMKKIKMELEERQRKQAKLVASAMSETVVKKLKEKDDQIQGMKKWNLILQDRIRSLYLENQLLREVARNNEATANSLRTNLEQVLLLQEEHVSGEEEEEVGSSCTGAGGSNEQQQVCRKCGEHESSVLLLPCRHLCLCNVCGSGSQVEMCPICHANTNATLHLNLSSS